jgi:hypothetical protein
MPKTASKPQKTVTTTKSAKIVGLLRRNNGATIAELAKATSWQDHSVRGFMSGTLKKKQGIQITSSQEDGRPRRYFIDGGDR